MSINEIRRIVTGQDAHGKAVFTEVGPLPTVVPLATIPGTVFHEILSRQQTLASVGNLLDSTLGPLVLSPSRHGTLIRIVDIPPDTEEFLQHGSQDARCVRADWRGRGVDGASGVAASLMHRTESIDYDVVLERALTLVLDDSETKLRPGDVVVQRGTNHAGANRSGAPCRMLFVRVDGQYDAALVQAQADR